MNKFNVKIGSSFALIAMVASVLLTAATPAVAALNDPEFDLALSWGYEAGLTSYNTEDAFMPMNTLTREQGARFLSQFATSVLGIEADDMMNCNFTDAALFDSTLTSYITMACEQGLLKGSNNRFMPTEPMTKAQFVTALVRGLDGMMPENVMPWYKNYCTWAQDNGITKETDCMALDRPITRYEALLMLYRGRVVGDDIMIDGEDTPTIGEDVTVTVGGEVAINISDNTPGVQFVPGTSTNIRALKFDITAGDNGVSISSINFKLEGLVNRNNVKVAITDADGVRLSTERNFNTNFEALVTANTSAGIKIPAKTTRSYYAVVSVSGSTNERFTISIPGAASVSATASVGGAFPIVSNQINTTEYSSQTLTFDGERALASTGVNSDRLYVGNMDKQVGQFRLSSTSSNSRDVTLKNIRLKSTDTVEGILSNLKLMVNGVNVASGVVVDGKFVTFIINDYVLPYGSSKTFYVMADVIGGERNDDVQFSLDETTDIVGLENGTNASVAISLGLTPKKYLKPYTIEEGDNFISRTDGLTSNTNVPTDADKVLALRANINVTSEISVDKMRVYFTGNATSGSIESVELYVNGLLVDEISPFVGGTPNYLDFAFFGNLKAGSNSVEVRIDTQRNAPNGEFIKFTLKNDALQGAEYVTTNNNVLASDISGTADGVFLIIRQAAAETISKTFLANPQIAIREGDITAIKFAIKANNVRDLVVRGFNVNISGYNNANGGIQDATLYVAGTTGIQDIESFSKGTSISFNSLNITIPASTSKEFWVITKSTVDLPATGSVDLQFFVNNFDIEDTEGNQTTANFSVAGNMIDVRASLEVFGNRTSVEQSTIIPANGNTAINIGTFEIKSDYAEALVEEITLVNLTTGFAGTTLNSGTIAGFTELSSDGSVVDLYQGVNLVGSAQLLQGLAYIDLSTPVSIAAGGTTVFSVKIRNNTTITSTGDTNKRIKFGVLSPGVVNNGPNSTAQTLISPVGNSVSANGQFTNLIFNDQYLRATTIVFADQASPTGTNTLLGIAGQIEATIFKTVVTSNASKSANIARLVFNHTFGGVTSGTNFKLKIDGTVLNTSDANCNFVAPKVTCDFAGGYINGLPIAAGGNKMIELVANVNSSTSTVDYISTSMLEGAANDFSMKTVAATNSNATVVWSDNAAFSVDYTAQNWFTDAGVEKLPSNAWTFSRQ